MFLPVDESQHASELPKDCSFREQDWHVLTSFWHPVAFAHEVTDQPVAAKLLDVDLVIYRTAEGITVAKDRCPHRGVRVSSGRIVDDRLICPMHGMHFDHTGQCRRIPSVPDPDAPISPRMRLETYQTEERYGIVWTCLKAEPIWPLPLWESIANPAYRKVYVPSDIWRSSAARHVENFNDVAHFPWVHTGSFGSDSRVIVSDYHVEETNTGLRFELPYEEGGNRFPDGADADKRDVLYTYELTFPFSTLLTVDPRGSNFVHYFADTVCPMTVDETRIFQVLTDTTGEPDSEYWIKDSLLINEEDKHLVEGQPIEVPLDARGELHHIPADRMSISYRKALVEKFGLGVCRTQD